MAIGKKNKVRADLSNYSVLFNGIAASLLNRRFLGLDKEESFLEISKKRRIEIEELKTRFEYREKIIKYADKPFKDILEIYEETPYFGIDLPVE